MSERTIIAADLFAGAGGTSTGLCNAARQLGYNVRLLAVNHWQVAIATHSVNHPDAKHLCESLDAVSPRQVVPEGRLDILVASPECIHHSKARGGRPMNEQSRASAWHVLRWAEALQIKSILIENVEEFRDWGPLDDHGRPIVSRKGATFRAFLTGLRSLGYRVRYQVINCADYGDPTTRRRLFIMARKGSPRPLFPQPTHAKEPDLFGTRPWRAAREIIDWSLSAPSIYARKRPLSENTLRRIEAGLRKFCGLPYVVTLNGTGESQIAASARGVDRPLPTQVGSNHHYLAQPFIVPCNHGRDERTYSVDEPMRTITSIDAWGLATPFLVEYHGGERSIERVRSLDVPLPTQDTSNRFALCRPFLVNYNGTGTAHSVDEPIDTVTARDRFGLATPLMVQLPDGQPALLDIGFRMLQPHELARAMSFPDDYQFQGTREEKVRQIGNAVPVRTAAALCGALLA